MAKQQPRRHVPQRTCIVCRQKTDKRQLTRIVRTPDGEIAVDRTGKQAGRGAYLCHRTSCWEEALSGNVLGRVLRTTIAPADKAALAEHQPAHGVEDPM